MEEPAGPIVPTALAALAELLRENRLRIVIDRRYPMAEIVEAHRYVETGRRAGKVVVAVVDD